MTRLHTTCITLLGTALLAAGCASTEAGKTAGAEQEICTREVPTGTIRPVTRCRSVAEVKKDEADAERELGFVRQTSPDTPGR